MITEEKKEFIMELIREGQIGANTANVILEYLKEEYDWYENQKHWKEHN